MAAGWLIHTQLGRRGEATMDFDDLPKAVWQGSFRLFGHDIECVVLDDGRRLVTEKGMEAFLAALESPATDLDEDELKAFAKWQQGG